MSGILANDHRPDERLSMHKALRFDSVSWPCDGHECSSYIRSCRHSRSVPQKLCFTDLYPEEFQNTWRVPSPSLSFRIPRHESCSAECFDNPRWPCFPDSTSVDLRQQSMLPPEDETSLRSKVFPRRKLHSPEKRGTGSQSDSAAQRCLKIYDWPVRPGHQPLAQESSRLAACLFGNRLRICRSASTDFQIWHERFGDVNKRYTVSVTASDRVELPAVSVSLDKLTSP